MFQSNGVPGYCNLVMKKTKDSHNGLRRGGLRIEELNLVHLQREAGCAETLERRCFFVLPSMKDPFCRAVRSRHNPAVVMMPASSVSAVIFVGTKDQIISFLFSGGACPKNCTLVRINCLGA